MMATRLLGILLGLMLMAAAFFIYLEIQYLGFPDGHKTALDRALAPLYSWLAGGSAGCGLYCLYLAAWTNVRQRERKMKAVAVVYGLLLAITVALGYALSLRLDTGAGG
jgi:hypothetical protein